MATLYISVNCDGGTLSKDPDHYGSSSTATDDIEIRLGTAGRSVSEREATVALRRIERFLRQNGFNGLGTGVPPRAGIGA